MAYRTSRSVTATTSSQEKINWLLGLPNGATHAANYKTEDFSAIVKQITGDKGVDVVIDFVGQSHFNKNLDSLAVDGRMTMLALMSGERIQDESFTVLNRYQGPWLIPLTWRSFFTSACILRARHFVLAISSTKQNSSPGKWTFL